MIDDHTAASLCPWLPVCCCCVVCCVWLFALRLTGGQPRRRCTWVWVSTKLKFAIVTLLIFVTFSVIPNLVYAFIRAQVR